MRFPASRLRERVIVLRDVPHDPSLGAALMPDVKRVIPSTANKGVGDQDDQFDAPCGVERTSQTTINGVPAATLGIRPGERQLWRVLNASAHRHFDLTVGRFGAQQRLQSLLLIRYRVFPFRLLQLLSRRLHRFRRGDHVLLKFTDGFDLIGKFASLEAAREGDRLIAQSGLRL